MLNGKRVLLVEDEFIIGFALEEMIADCGAFPTLATSVAEAEEELAKGDFEFAIVDVNLNGTASYPIADTLALKDCHFVFATGYGDVMHPARFAAVPTVSKPYSREGILRALSQSGDVPGE